MIEKTLGYLSKIVKVDSVNAVNSLAYVVWFQGCSYACKGCQNPHTWKLKSGQPLTKAKLDEILAEIPEGFALTLLGGDPLEQQNLDATKYLINNFKAKNPHSDVLIWTGRNYPVAKGLLGSSVKNVDFIKCGEFDITKFRKGLRYYGSTNQDMFYLKDGLIDSVWSDENTTFIKNTREA